jgi:hypothetical protein
MDTVRAISWEAPEFSHREKSSDWYFAVGLLVAAAIIAALLLGNILFAFLVFVSGVVFAVAAAKRPRIIPFAVTIHGVRVGSQLFTMTQLQSFRVDTEDPRGPQLLLMVRTKFMPLMVIPIPPDYIDEVQEILQSRLPEEPLQESLSVRLLEYFGF